MVRLGKKPGLGRNAHYDAGIRLYDQGLYEAAIQELAKVSASEKEAHDRMTERLAAFYTAEAYTHLGHTAMSTQRWDKARDYFGRALELHPHYADLHFQLALAYRATKEWDLALESLHNALDINPRFAKAHFTRGLIRYEMGEHDAGLRDLCTAMELEPGFRTEAFVNGLRSHLEGDAETALRCFEQVSQADVDDILFHFKLGDDLSQRGLYDQAAAEYTKALEIHPGYADIRNHLGLAYSAQGRIDEAISEFRRALAINPRYVDAMVNLANLLREQGRIEEARSLFAQVLTTAPDDPVAWEQAREVGTIADGGEPAADSARKEKQESRVA